MSTGLNAHKPDAMQPATDHSEREPSLKDNYHIVTRHCKNWPVFEDETDSSSVRPNEGIPVSATSEESGNTEVRYDEAELDMLIESVGKPIQCKTHWPVIDDERAEDAVEVCRKAIAATDDRRNESTPPTSVEDFDWESLETGDILLFSEKAWSNFGWFSRLIEFFTGCPWSHVAVVVRNPRFTTPPLKGLFFLESGSEPNGDVENGRVKWGVQLTPLETIRTYPGQVVVRRLTCDRNDSFYDAWDRIHSDVHNLSYDTSVTDYLAALKTLYCNGRVTGKDLRGRSDRFWCSALVGYVYVKLGLLDPDTDWTLLLPRYFAEGCPRLTFANCTLGSHVTLR